MNKNDQEQELEKNELPSWCLFRGDHKQKTDIKLPKAPPWRQKNKKEEKEFNSYIPLSQKEIKMVNTALLLRRPLLITGKPGSGKSSLAEAVRKELSLGDKVLHWRITTQSKFTDGLYSYDALSRLQDIQFKEKKDGVLISKDIGNYLQLEALGIAFTSEQQRVVLIDEIDKSQIDLPNNLLHLFEENEFEIPELKRLGVTYESSTNSKISHIIKNRGLVTCDIETFPLIIMTSNGERDFPPAFMRRCIHLKMELPNAKDLANIVNRHFESIGEVVDKEALSKIIESFITLRDDESNKKYLSTDQLLNAVYLMNQKESVDINDVDIQDGIWRNLLG